MNVYRITFHKTKFLFTEHFEATAENANHYHVMKNNRKMGEQSKLWKAIKIILDDTGDNLELKNLIKKEYLLRKHDPVFQCVGITFYDNDKYGLKIEMKLSGNITS